MSYYVTCLRDDGTRHPATKRLFELRGDAEEYLRTVAPERHPLVVELGVLSVVAADFYLRRLYDLLHEATSWAVEPESEHRIRETPDWVAEATSLLAEVRELERVGP